MFWLHRQREFGGAGVVSSFDNRGRLRHLPSFSRPSFSTLGIDVLEMRLE